MTHDQPDKQYLSTRQYRDSSNLNARGSLHARYQTNPYSWFRWVFDQLHPHAPADARILEVGAGPGGLWRENLDRLPANWRVTLTDFSDGMVTEERAALPGQQFAFTVADVESLPFADASFDLAIANHMLYHVPDRPHALAELQRVLRPSGVLIAASNGQDNMRELDELFREMAPDALTETWKASLSHPFELENGAAQLALFFEDIEICLYEDALNVTDVAPLVAYVLSIDTPGMREPDVAAALTTRIGEVMRQNSGVFHITKSVGMFTARRTV